MKTTRNITLLLLLILCSLTVLGCSEKEEAVPPADGSIDESKPISKVKAEAEKMDAEQLRATALKYKAAIDAKTVEIEKLATELIKAMGTDKTDEKEKLNAQMTKLNKSVEALAEQFDIYVEKLKEKGGDVSGLDM